MDVFAALAHEDDAEQMAVANSRAVEAVKVRVAHQFGAYVKLAKSPEDFVARVDMIAERVVSLSNATAQEYGASDVDSVVEAATEALHTAGGHKDGCECGFCKNKGKLPGSKKDEDEDESDESDDKDEKDESDNPFEKDAERKSSLRDSIWHTAAGPEPEDGDNSTKERIDPDGSAGASPEIDKSKVPAGGLKPIDVPSKAHPSESQSVSEGDGYGTYPKGGDPNPAAPTRKQVDADKAIQPEHNVAPHTDTWSTETGQANPVTSNWRVVS